METITMCRLALIYAHLLLCVFAMQTVLRTDWRVLRGSIDVDQLLEVHRLLLWLLAGLWATGLTIAGIDLGFDPALLPERPKLVVKLASVAVLSVNGLLLRHWCFPRLSRQASLSAAEHSALMAIGAVSTASWLMAAFFGVARPLSEWSVHACLGLYGAALGMAVLGALALSLATRQRSSSIRSCATR